MKFGGIGVPELLIILAVALLIFGPKNLPKLGSALGKTVKNLRDGMDSGKKDTAVDEAEEAEVDEDSEVIEETPKALKTAAKKKSSGSSSRKAAARKSADPVA